MKDKNDVRINVSDVLGAIDLILEENNDPNLNHASSHLKYLICDEYTKRERGGRRSKISRLYDVLGRYDQWRHANVRALNYSNLVTDASKTLRRYILAITSIQIAREMNTAVLISNSGIGMQHVLETVKDLHTLYKYDKIDENDAVAHLKKVTRNIFIVGLLTVLIREHGSDMSATINNSDIEHAIRVSTATTAERVGKLSFGPSHNNEFILNVIGSCVSDFIGCINNVSIMNQAIKYVYRVHMEEEQYFDTSDYGFFDDIEVAKKAFIRLSKIPEHMIEDSEIKMVNSPDPMKHVTTMYSVTIPSDDEGDEDGDIWYLSAIRILY